MSNKILEAKNIFFSYDKKNILEDISLVLEQGDIISLLGENGAGKSTLIKILLGLQKPKAGEVFLYNKNLKSYSHKNIAKQLAYIPQSNNLAFSFSVFEVVLSARISYQSMFSSYCEKDKKIAKESLDFLNIIHLKNRLFNELSGGQKQLVLIARALSQGAKTFIMDEPISGLDYGNCLRLLEQIKILAKQGYTFLKSTHHPEHAFLVSNKVILIKNKKILAQGKTAEVLSEKNLKTLYDIDINIEKNSHGYNTCIPRFMHK